MTDYVNEADYEPARVHIVKDDTRPDSLSKEFVNVVSRTFLAGTTPELILPRSQARRHAVITVLGVVGTAGNIVLADTPADAQAAVTYTQTASIGGAGLQPGMVIDVFHHEEVWLSRLGTAGTAPLVSVIAEYCKYPS
jgi:hypothetical protein